MAGQVVLAVAAPRTRTVGVKGTVRLVPGRSEVELSQATSGAVRAEGNEATVRPELDPWAKR